MGRIVESAHFQVFIAWVILVNAAGLGLETSAGIVQVAGPALDWVGRVCLGIFVVELSLRVIAYGWRFFSRGWNLFDFVIVVVTAVPAWPNLSVLRALRILRALRFFSVIPRLRMVVQAMVTAIPSMASLLFLMLLWFYIAGVLATQFFGKPFDDWFGTIGRSMYSLFQIMTLESWSMGIVRPVMQVYPAAWAFFVPFIMVTTFTMLNLFIAFLVSATQNQQQAEEKQQGLAAIPADGDSGALVEQITLLRREVAELRKSLDSEHVRTPQQRQESKAG
ncbi:MAG: ion transporter [Verrucomicrobiota bacterium]